MLPQNHGQQSIMGIQGTPSSVFTNESGSFMEPTQLLDFVLTNEVKAADAK